MLAEVDSSHLSLDSWQAFAGYLPLQSIDSFHYSKTFKANLGVNPLVAAAAALFVVIAKFSKIHHGDHLGQLHIQLIHEVRAFECHAIAQHYDPKVIVAARYAIVAALDEIVQRSLAQPDQWQQQYSLTAYFYQKQAEQNFFFQFLKSLITSDNLPLDLLEFCYLCLNLAFVGLHRTDKLEFNQVQEISNQLFDIIHRRKITKKPALLIGQLKPIKLLSRLNLQFHWRILATVSLIMGISIYFGFNYIMAASTESLYVKFSQIIDENHTQFS